MTLLIEFCAILFSTSVWFWLLRRKDLFSPEPLWFLCKIMMLGGLLSAIPAGLLNSLVSEQYETSFLLALWKNSFIGFNEEFWKLLVTVYLIKNHRYFDEPVDGVIYAATVALGFAAIENVEYISRYGLNTLVPRHFISVPSHLAFSMLWGYGLSLAKFKYPKRHLLSVIWPYFFAAVFCHALFNFTIGLNPERLDIIMVLLLVIALYRYDSYQITSLLRYSPLRTANQCPSCKKVNQESRRFCQKCGNEVNSVPSFSMLYQPDRKNIYFTELSLINSPNNA